MDKKRSNRGLLAVAARDALSWRARGRKDAPGITRCQCRFPAHSVGFIPPEERSPEDTWDTSRCHNAGVEKASWGAQKGAWVCADCARHHTKDWTPRKGRFTGR